MGRWDRELIELLPESCRISASAGAGYDWVDVDVMAEHGEFFILHSAHIILLSILDGY